MATATIPPVREHHGSRAYQLVAATVVALVLPTVFLGLRIFARHVLRIRLYFDDWLIIIAYVFKVGLDISGSLLIEHGMGRPISTVSAKDLTIFAKIQYTGVIQYPLCVTFTKLSILYQYRRLFPNHDFKLMTNVLIAMMIMWCTAVMFVGIFICTPIRKAWEPLIPGKCISLIPFYYGMQIPNVITDLLILLLPLREVQKLELPFKQKIGVAITCFLWVISLIIGIVRLAVMVEMMNEGTDMTWILVSPAIWTTIEPAVQITTACLPALRVLYRKWAGGKKKPVNSTRLRSLSLSSRRGVDVVDGSSVGGTTSYGSWTTKDTMNQPATKARDVFV